MNNTTSYLLYLPNEVLNKVRTLSAKRKAEKANNRTQKDILIEMIEIGLMMTEPSNATPYEAHSNSVNENEMQDNPKQIKLV